MDRRWARELGKPSPAPGVRCPGAAGAYNRPNGKSHRAGRVADGVVVPDEPVDNITTGEGRAPAASHAC
jgi:hypothetical protein